MASRACSSSLPSGTLTCAASMRAIWALSALPYPVRITLTWLGLYSNTGTPRSSSTARIAPRACATATALVAFRPMKSSSSEASAGGFSSSSLRRYAVITSSRSPSRPGRVTTVLHASTRLGSDNSANPVLASPGSMPRISPFWLPAICPSAFTPVLRRVLERWLGCRTTRVRTSVLPRGPPPEKTPGHAWEASGEEMSGDGRSKSGLLATFQLIPFIPVRRRVLGRWLGCRSWRKPAGRRRPPRVIPSA